MVKKEDFTVLGKITGVHGLKGKLRLYSYSGSVSSLKPGVKILVKNRGKEIFFDVTGISAQKKNFLISFEGVDTVESAQTLTGSKILIENSSLPDLPEGEYYWKDLIGLMVNSSDGTCFGTIKTIMETGSNDVFVVKDGEKEILIPFIDQVVKNVDLENGNVLVELPDGLLDL